MKRILTFPAAFNVIKLCPFVTDSQVIKASFQSAMLAVIYVKTNLKTDFLNMIDKSPM